MYVHFCRQCRRIHLLNGHKMFCPRCEKELKELQIPYMEYVQLKSEERSRLVEMCTDDSCLNEISTTYRMYKYSKWYRKLCAASQL